MNKQLNRRDFLRSAALNSAGLVILSNSRLVRGTQANEKLNVACIGVGGRGAADVNGVGATENIYALCDVDEKHAAQTFEKYPQAKRYKDFRRMLDEIQDKIDAVVVGTPDHIHAVAGMAAMKLGKHCYCEKPLTHSVYEARQMANLAREKKLVTQMGTQIHAENNYRRVVELVQTNAIGKIREVHVWLAADFKGPPTPTDIFQPNLPSDSPPVPETLDWDLWLGPAPWRPYNHIYLPANWRKWWDFGTGTLGDMGCHIIDPVFWALDLGYPTSVEANPNKFTKEGYPTETTVHWEFPARGDLPAVTVTWNDGNRRPDRPAELEAGRKLPSQGGLYYGEKGTILAPHGSTPMLIPYSKMRGVKMPEPFLGRGVNHYQDWIKACKGGPKPLANFDYAGPLSETILLGNVAALAGEKVLWDGPNLRATNVPEANEHLKRNYRAGWQL